jgi:DNA-3-methyladenine glycosylase I
MQAVGMVNDHGPGCICRTRTDAARAAFQRPAV